MTEHSAFQRLPSNVVPTNYKLCLEPDLNKFDVNGSVSICLDVKSPTEKIVLNSLEIDIKDASIKINDKTLNCKQKNCGPHETFELTFPEKIPVGTACLEMKFISKLGDKLKGFYRSQYVNLKGEKEYLAVTQFEATDARRAFPCWDEPAIKATFDVTLIVPQNKIALSNMDVKLENTLANGKKEYVFNRTPIMSTYLVAFCVGEFDYIEQKTTNNTLVRVYTPKNKSENGKFALEVAVNTLPFYEDYFQQEYPLPKCDLIAIPDFAAGAMENWGLITYRETLLLIDEKNSSSSVKQNVALVVGHELAHQWFGNLVTMEWWTHLWLNEGFASWIEYLCVDNCFKEYDIWTQFSFHDYARALELDSLINSHPIEVEVSNPTEIDEIFDAISYSKGASIIRMLNDYLGDDQFKLGLTKYLRKYKYKNALTEDLWSCLSETGSVNVQSLMECWTKIKGYPVVSVDSKRNNDGILLTLTQSQFLLSSSGEDIENNLWTIPVSIITDNGHVKKVLLKDKVTCFSLDSDVKWFKVNHSSVGFYRVKYERFSDIKSITSNLHELNSIDRFSLQNDIFALARATMLSSTDYLNVIKSYSNEDNFTVMSDILSNLSCLDLLIQQNLPDDVTKFRKFFMTTLEPIAKTIGFSNDLNSLKHVDSSYGGSHLTAMLRNMVFGKLGRWGHPSTVQMCLKLFDDHCNGKDTLVPDLRTTVYSTCLANGPESVYDRLLKLYRETDLQEERVRILSVLGSVPESLYDRVLEFSISSEVRSQDAVICISSVASSASGLCKAYNFMKSNWKLFFERYNGGFLMNSLIKACCSKFSDPSMISEIEEFFQDCNVAKRTIQQCLESININKKWISNDINALSEWISNGN